MKRIVAVLLLLSVVATFGLIRDAKADAKPPAKETAKPEDHGIKPDGPKDTPPKTIEDVKPWGDTAGKAFDARAAFTVTIEKLDKPDAKGAAFGYFFGGSATPQSAETLFATLLKYAKFRHEKNGYPGWMTDRYSENVVAVRCDPTAPWSLVEEIISSTTAAEMYRMAIAPRDAFKASDYAKENDRRLLLTTLGEPYYQFSWETPGVVTVPKEKITLYANATAGETEFLIAVGARARTVVPNSRTTLAAISPDLAADDAGKAKAKAARAKFITSIAEAVAGCVMNMNAKIETLDFVGTYHENVEPWGTKYAEAGFAFVVIEALKQANKTLKSNGKPEVQLRLREPVPVPPPPTKKPEEEVEYPKDEPMPDEKPIEETPDDK